VTPPALSTSTPLSGVEMSRPGLSPGVETERGATSDDPLTGVGPGADPRGEAVAEAPNAGVRGDGHVSRDSRERPALLGGSDGIGAGEKGGPDVR
jgi:hypothetical protein